MCIRDSVTTTTNTIGPNSKAIDGSVPITLPAKTPAKPARAQPNPKTLLNTLGTLWPSAETILGFVNEAFIIKPVLVFANILSATSF